VTWEALFARRTLGVRLELEQVLQAHAALGAPGHAVPTILVVGTNGKGSAAALAAHALCTSGYGRVGLYTSPHLSRVGERVRIDGLPVPDDDLESAVQRVLAVEPGLDLPRPLSFFELLTLGALLVFADAGVDAMVLEAGLGGRLDATRVIEPAAVALTQVALDHEAYLGSTLAQIAGEKVAVFRRGVPAFSSPQHVEVVPVVEAAARKTGAPLFWPEPLGRPPHGLAGDHQRENAAVALAAARVLSPPLREEDLDGVSWPARLERVEHGGGVVILDVAHNLEGVCALVRHIRDQDEAGGAGSRILFGCMSDKDGAGMVREFATLGMPLWLVPPPAEGAYPPSSMADLVPGARVFDSLDDHSLEVAWSAHLGGGGRLWVCGSHFLVGAVRRRLSGDAAGPPDPGDPIRRC
jgi:dihydrofolate synthase/folylpolyglutamate synthase